jgi:hypothetical protein
VKRWLFNLTAAASMLLLVATIVLWVRSHWINADAAEGFLLGWRSSANVRPYRGGALMFLSDTGAIRIECNNLTLTDERRIAPYLEQPERRAMSYAEGARPPWPLTWWRTLRFDWKAPHVKRSPPQSTVVNWFVRVPYWFVCLPFMLAPALWLNRWRIFVRRRRRVAAGLCPQCGYDLRGAIHERCPECGKDVSPVLSDHAPSLSA